MNTAELHQYITDRFIQALEEGTPPWRKSWAGAHGGHPTNMATGARYRGTNVFLLAMSPYSSKYWGSVKQINSRGGRLRKGERGTLIVFYKQLGIEDKETKERRTIPFLRYSHVFNAEQCTGLELPGESVPDNDHDPIAEAERILDAAPIAPIEYVPGSDRAYYRPSSDVITMPTIRQFESAASFYMTAFHEATHSTGHATRLDREGITNVAPFGAPVYSREELIAELGAAFVGAECGVLDVAEFSNSAAYLAGWIKALKGDSKLIMSATGRAQAAADWILCRKEALDSAAL